MAEETPPPSPEDEETIETGVSSATNEQRIDTKNAYGTDVIQPSFKSLQEIYQYLRDIDTPYDHMIMLEHWLTKYYPAVQIYDEDHFRENYEIFPGKLKETFTSAAGLTVYVFEYAIIVGCGEKALAGYGNRSHLIDTLLEVIAEHVAQTTWKVRFTATHPIYEGIAWAIGYMYGLEINHTPPSDYAYEVAMRLEGLYGKDVPRRYLKTDTTAPKR